MLGLDLRAVWPVAARGPFHKHAYDITRADCGGGADIVLGAQARIRSLPLLSPLPPLLDFTYPHYCLLLIVLIL